MVELSWASAVQFLSILFCAGMTLALLNRRNAIPAAMGASVMAVGIFGLASLPQLISQSAPMIWLFRAELLIVWGALAISYLRSCFREGLARFTQDPLARFGVGTWVAATSLLVQSLRKFPFDRYPFIWLFALLALVIWLWFLKLAIRGMRRIAADPARWEVTGAVLLATVSTQSVALMLFSLFADQVPGLIYMLLIGIGYVFYGAGLFLIVRHYAKQKPIHLLTNWSASNCIMHGALSITGLAGTVTGASPRPLVLGTWIVAAGLFLIVEGIEIRRMIERIREMGWRQAIWTYNVAQWARNFTFGMFYAFTLEMHRHHIRFEEFGHYGMSPVIEHVIRFGPYIVLFFLLAELVLYLMSELSPRTASHVSVPPPAPNK